MNILKVDNLSVTESDHKIIDSVSFTLEKGQTMAIIGPNGAGKTTLFRAILNLIPYEGNVEWMKGVKIGYVPQKLFVERDFPISVFEFMSLKNSPKNEIINVMETVGFDTRKIHSLIKQKLGSLSGGEFQRVLIAWSLLDSPDILLFDEPTAGVDLVGEETVYNMLDRIKLKKELTIILISHEIDIVRKHTDLVLCLNKERVCYGPPLKVMTQDTMDKLFNEEVHLYSHKH